MATKRSNFELKVGLFTFIGLLILFMIVFSIGDFYLLNPGYTLTIQFGTANGIDIGAPVHVAGVIVGEVKGIKVYFDEGKTKVDLLVWLKKGSLVPDNSIAQIKTLGLLGEKFLDIYPGQDPKKFLQEGDLLIGADPVSMDELIGRGNALVGKLEGSAESFHNILKKIETGEGTIGRLIVDDSLYMNMEGFVQDIRKHPWKLLHRGKRSEDKKVSEGNKGMFHQRR